nr:MAG TPA: Mitochondrial FAD-linked sulfhydryl oxidase ERV1-linked sulfhydryl oxidase, Mia40, oxidation [Caudoviricetes sp.]
MRETGLQIIVELILSPETKPCRACSKVGAS